MIFKSSGHKQPEGLIGVLLSQNSILEDRMEAAEDLGIYDEPEALRALIEVASDSTEDESLLECAGVSIADIWNRKNNAEATAFAKLAPAARRELLVMLNPKLGEGLSDR